MSAQICWIVLASAAVGQGEPAASVELDAEAFGLDALVDRSDLQFEDRQAYFGILARLREVDPRALSQAAAELRHERWATINDLGEFTEDEFPVFVDLFLHPDVYRGKPVTLRGHLVGPISSYSDENEYGLDPLYEAHLFDVDSQSNPATIIFTELPPSLDLDAVAVDGLAISVTGYFLKLHTYRSVSGERQIAPLILARSIAVRAPVVTESHVPGWPLVGLILAVAIIALLVVLKTGRENRRVRNEYRERFESEPEFDASEVRLDE